MSTKSGVSSNSSGSLRLKATENVEKARVALRYHDEKERLKAELTRLEIEQTLETAQSTLRAIEVCERDTKNLDNLSETSGNRKVSDYLLSPNMPVLTPVQTSVSQPIPVVGPSQSTSTPYHEFRPHHSEFHPHPHNPEFQPIPQFPSPTTNYHTNPGFQTPVQSAFNQPMPSPFVSLNQPYLAPPQTPIVNNADILKFLTDQAYLNRLPSPEPAVFSGEPLEYPSWKAGFKALVERDGVPVEQRMFYLQKYLAGPAKSCVKNFFLFNTEQSYNDAKALLESRYGDPVTISQTFKRKLENWNRIRSGDGTGLRAYADFLNQCLSAMSLVQSLEFLNHDIEIKLLSNKLPDWMCNRWARYSYENKQAKGVYPSFREFVRFVVKESDILCDPLNARTKTDFPSKKPAQSSSIRGGNNSLVSLKTDSSSAPSTSQCKQCNGQHNLVNCPEVKSKSLEERKEIFFKNYLCFGCLKPDHVSRECPNRAKCDICAKLHPTLLHGNFGKQKTELEPKNDNTIPKSVSLHVTKNVSVKSKSSMILPVYVSHSESPDKELLVYVILDNQSDTTYIWSKSAEQLDLKGVNVNLSLSTMTSVNQIISSVRYSGLSVRAIDSSVRWLLPPTYSRDIMPVNRDHIPVPSMVDNFPYLEKIRKEIHPLYDCDVAILIGYDCPKLLAPIDVIPAVKDGPFAQKTVLGWGIVGVLENESIGEDKIGISHRIIANESQSYIALQSKTKEVSPDTVLKMFNLDFNEKFQDQESYSREENLFLDKMSSSIHRTSENRYEMQLPFKRSDPLLPNNKQFAVKRMRTLSNRLSRNPELYSDYSSFMNDIIKRGYCELVPLDELDSPKSWLIPHHSVYHPKKPGKVRVVFDCNASYNNVNLNDLLLKGPDLNCLLAGLLCRFRKNRFAFTCDIEKMFYQFKVNESHRNYLRFLWFKDGLKSDLVEWRMNVHLFGAVSSPSCSIFGLQQAAKDYEHEFGSAVSHFIQNEFYVDDGLLSVETEKEAIEIIQGSCDLLAKCGIHLHKFVSNSVSILESIPEEDRAQDISNFDLNFDTLLSERVLGVNWCVGNDIFNFRVSLQDKPLTRRGILSTISSIYDPLGFISPFILIGKQVLQELCRDSADWDTPLPDRLLPSWETWICDVYKLETVHLNRCLKPKDFGEIREISMHHFSDASTSGYGSCSYIRFVNEYGRVHCALLMGKSRVVPLRAVTIPRLELTAAVISVKISQLLDKELRYENVKHFFYTDSTVVLSYISNDVRRFQTFVANRVQLIRDLTDRNQWHYVKSAENPADVASRGAYVEDLKNSIWFSGPRFLLENNDEFDFERKFELNLDDPEIKKSVVFATCNNPVLEETFTRFSSWYNLKRVIAICLKYKMILRNNVLGNNSFIDRSISVDDLVKAEIEIIKCVQHSVYKDEIVKLTGNNSRRSLKRSSSLYRLDPFINSDGLLCVGGRFKSNNLDVSETHPIILPRKHHVTSLIIRHYHILCEHQGKGITVNNIRSNGYWIVACNSAVYEYVSKCVNCRKFRCQSQSQKMGNIPEERLHHSPPFTVCACDCFGPFIVKNGRKELKRYGLLFTCMCSRAVHVETLHSMSTDSFINGLRRFVSIRGPIRSLYCDNGSNFVGAKSDLFGLFKDLDQDAIKDFLIRNNCDYFQFKFTVPNASHMNGVVERQIRSVRNVLVSLLSQCSSQLDDESLNTFMFEAAAIVNSRPLSVDTLNDPMSLNPLTPNHLLTMKSNIVLPPPGDFVKQDIYLKKYWKRVQYICNVFWSRWKTEYLQSLQIRQKWNNPKRNISIGDVVLLVDDNLPRNCWSLCRVVETFAGNDNLVRKVKLLVGNKSLDKNGKAMQQPSYLERPIHRVVLLLESDCA